MLHCSPAQAPALTSAMPLRYPHAVEAKVVGVTDCSADWRLSKLQSGTVVQRIPLAGNTKDVRTSAAEDALSKLRSGQGIDVSESHVYLEVRTPACTHAAQIALCLLVNVATLATWLSDRILRNDSLCAGGSSKRTADSRERDHQ